MIKIKFIKASVIILPVLFIFFKTGYSQIVYSNTPSLKFSFTGGLTVSDLFKDTVNYTPAIFFNGGFALGIRCNDKWNIAADIFYTGKAIKTDKPIVKYKYFYFDIPVYAQYNFNDKFRINGGAQFSGFTNSFVTFIDGGNSNGVKTEKYKNIKNSDYSVLLGTEMDLSDNFNIGIRYTLSGSALFEKNKVSFGVSNIVLRYTIYKSYRQFFVKNSKE